MAWTQDQIVKIMIATTGCLCLLILVTGAMIGVVYGKLSPQLLGGLGAGGAATGIVALAVIVFWVIRLSRGQ